MKKDAAAEGTSLLPFIERSYAELTWPATKKPKISAAQIRVQKGSLASPSPP